MSHEWDDVYLAKGLALRTQIRTKNLGKASVYRAVPAATPSPSAGVRNLPSRLLHFLRSLHFEETAVVETAKHRVTA